MRLIDADEVKKAFIGNRYGTKAIEYVIDDAPTVKAIPIEWIEQFMNRFRVGMVTSDEYALLHFMLTEWEKEYDNLER